MSETDLKHDAAYGVIPVKKKDGVWHFLLVKHIIGPWGFPGGHRHIGENELEAARRELWEETGITECFIKTDKKYIADFFFNREEQRVNKKNAYFLGFPDDGQEPKTPEEFKEEIVDCAWFTAEEIKVKIGRPAVLRLINEVSKDLD
jgi:8-oxo-dGTP pyrophosphatase MutT (NUDIX family)